ncbi:hypothetical protein BPTFM16_00254 [Altererythrobacter insulae]|nr:hypothetical protein BPTFM16_00254 [Altererythrobacter insulae]
MVMNTPDIDSLAASADTMRRAGDLTSAAQIFDQILAEHPGQLRAMRGRARIALARGESDALERFDNALNVDPGDADLWLGKAQALDLVGDADGAMAVAQRICDQAPGWLEGLRFLARLKLANGDKDFTSHYSDALTRLPEDPNIWYDWANQLAGADRFGEAAEIAERASARFAKEQAFVLQHATHASSAGDLDLADQLFGELSIGSADYRRNAARHRIRKREFERAESMLDQVITEDQSDIAAWALLGLVWRMTDDRKADWLHGQPGLFGLHELADCDSVLPRAIALLNDLHDQASLPIGQSLRGGTQTRGNLFDRLEPELTMLRDAIQETLAQFRSGLPAHDEAHPILRHRDQRWSLAGSWSVRLSAGGDHHKAHIHPAGVISSALYLEVPLNAVQSPNRDGWLEIGRPPADLNLELEPLATIKPKAGHLALFPSTLYHGTRTFDAGQRMSVAFDVVAKP